MNNLQIEIHTFLKGQLSQALAAHMLDVCFNGNIAVICKTPTRLMNQVKKEWIHLTSRKSTYLKNLSFSDASPFDDIQANVAFSTIEKFRLFPPTCTTLYVTQPVTDQDMYILTSWLPSHAMVILFKEVQA